MKKSDLTNKILKGVLSVAILTSLTACVPQELVSSDLDYDILDTNSGDYLASDSLQNGITQELDVPGEDFKLLIQYMSGVDSWTVTSDKDLHMSILTKGLNSSEKEVYIDNIHIDTFLVATEPIFNGIKQDTVDDHIHNSDMIGFPIDDTNSYYGINEIEGQNDEFIKGTYYAYQGLGGGGNIVEKRRLESDYLSHGVWANKISGVVGLIIKDKTTGETRGVDVKTTLLVAVNNQIQFQKSDGSIVTYEYDRYGNYEEITTRKRVK